MARGGSEDGASHEFTPAHAPVRTPILPEQEVRVPMKAKKPLFVLLLILTLLAVALIMPSVAQAKGPKATIIVGTSLPYPPYEQYKNDKNANKLAGFDIDLVTQIAKMNKWKVEFQVTDFWMLIPDLQSGVLDMAASAFAIRPERELLIDFSIPYITDLSTGDQYGFGFAKDSALEGPVNDALREIMADGTYAKIYLKWFGVEPPVTP